MAEIAVSVLNSDNSRWREWLPLLEKAGIDRIQFDIMDRKFVPNTGVPKEFVAELRPQTKLFFESHLMVLRPENYVKGFAEMGNQLLIFHAEATKKPLKLIESIEEHGMRVGIAVNSKTPAEKIFPYLDKVDLALVMGVEAGLGGQEFNGKAIEKISTLRKKIGELGAQCKLEVDGGINAETGKKCVYAGADVLVAGTFIFRHPMGIEAAVKELRQI